MTRSHARTWLRLQRRGFRMHGHGFCCFTVRGCKLRAGLAPKLAQPAQVPLARASPRCGRGDAGSEGGGKGREGVAVRPDADSVLCTLLRCAARGGSCVAVRTACAGGWVCGCEWVRGSVDDHSCAVRYLPGLTMPRCRSPTILEDSASESSNHLLRVCCSRTLPLENSHVEYLVLTRQPAERQYRFATHLVCIL